MRNEHTRSRKISFDGSVAFALVWVYYWCIVSPLGIIMLTCKQILKAVDNPFLQLYQGNGYWYFVYDDPATNIYEDHSVHTYRLNSLSLEQWKAEANQFIADVKEKTDFWNSVKNG